MIHSMIQGRLSRPLSYRLFFLLAGNVALLSAIFFLLKPGASFFSVLSSSLYHVAPSLLAALGLTGIILCGAIDLSIGAIVAVAGTVFGILVFYEAPPWLCYVTCVLTSGLLSVANGYLVRWIRIPAIIVTLGGLTFYRGVALIVADMGIENFSGNISIQDQIYQAPSDIAGVILILSIALALGWEWCAETPRRWLALGNSEEACRIQGLRPGKILQSAFWVGGLLLGLASLLEVTRRTAIEPARLALGFELKVIGAVVLGGSNIFGGEGCYLGTILAAFFLFFVEQALSYADVSQYYRDVLIGATIIVVIGVDCYLHRNRKRLEELQ